MDPRCGRGAVRHRAPPLARSPGRYRPQPPGGCSRCQGPPPHRGRQDRRRAFTGSRGTCRVRGSRARPGVVARDADSGLVLLRLLDSRPLPGAAPAATNNACTRAPHQRAAPHRDAQGIRAGGTHESVLRPADRTRHRHGHLGWCARARHRAGHRSPDHARQHEPHRLGTGRSRARGLAVRHGRAMARCKGPPRRPAARYRCGPADARRRRRGPPSGRADASVPRSQPRRAGIRDPRRAATIARVGPRRARRPGHPVPTRQ